MTSSLPTLWLFVAAPPTAPGAGEALAQAHAEAAGRAPHPGDPIWTGPGMDPRGRAGVPGPAGHGRGEPLQPKRPEPRTHRGRPAGLDPVVERRGLARPSRGWRGAVGPLPVSTAARPGPVLRAGLPRSRGARVPAAPGGPGGPRPGGAAVHPRSGSGGPGRTGSGRGDRAPSRRPPGRSMSCPAPWKRTPWPQRLPRLPPSSASETQPGPAPRPCFASRRNRRRARSSRKRGRSWARPGCPDPGPTPRRCTGDASGRPYPQGPMPPSRAGDHGIRARSTGAPTRGARTPPLRPKTDAVPQPPKNDPGGLRHRGRASSPRGLVR